MLIRSFISFCLAACAIPALAGGPLGEGLVRIEVLDGGGMRDGRHQAALHLRLADGWKTYWRAPGEAGVPPMFDWHGSHNVGAVEIVWPTPVVFDQNGMRSIGYKDELVLPLIIQPERAGTPVRLSGSIEFGICKDVCIPAELQFSSNLDRAKGRNPLIAAAMAQAPFTAREAGVKRASCDLRPVDGGLKVEARVRMPRIDGHETVVIEPSDPTLWSSEATSEWHADTLVAQGELLHPEGGMIALDRSALTITVIGNGRSVEIRGCPQG